MKKERLEMSSSANSLEEEIQLVQKQYHETAAHLTKLRTETAAILQKEILAELSQLNMPHTLGNCRRIAHTGSTGNG